MVFLFTWNASFEASPADTDDASEGATRIRNTKVAISERAEIDHNWNGGTDDGEHKKVTFGAPISDPTNAANKGFLYIKDVNGKAELHWEDEDGNVLQLTSAGALTVLASELYESTDAGAASGPSVELYRNSASPAASDFIGSYPLTGESSTGAKVTYAELLAQIIDPTNAAEDARKIIRTMVAGALTDILTIGPGLQVGTPTGGDQGAGTINAAGAITVNGVAVAAEASQAEMEAASSSTVYVTPANTHQHPGVVKAWARWNNSGTLAASYNVASITDHGTGAWTVNIDADFSSGDYGVLSSCASPAAGTFSWQVRQLSTVAPTAGTCRFMGQTDNSNVADPARIWAAFLGDQ